MQRPIRSLASPPGAGEWLPLAQHRHRAQVSLDDIIAVTKISRRFLEAIENGDLRQLPGGIIGINYIRQYAQAIGYDPELILDRYRQFQVEPDSPPEQPPVRTPQTQSILRLARFLSIG